MQRKIPKGAMTNMHLEEKTIESHMAYEGRIVKVKSDTVLLEDGSQALREVITHYGGSSVLPLTEDNEIIMVKQFRYPFGEVLPEIPAGKLNYKGEDPLEAGKRELLEETGAVAEKIVKIGELYPIPAYVTEVIHIFLATGLTFREQQLDKDEFLDVIRVPFDKALEMVMNGEIKDAKTQIAILKAKLLMEKDEI